MNKAIEFAKTIVDIPDEDLSIIMLSKKTLLFSGKVPWVKKERDEDFDVPMGCYDGAEVCEIVEFYILNLLSNILDKGLLGLYRDDGVAIVRNLSCPEIEKKRKAIIKLFRECELNIIQTNLKIVNFLHVEMNLGTGTYRPYRKPDDMPVYINRKSNHPPTIIKEIPKAIAKRISDVSSSEVAFNELIPTYSDAVRKSGFHDNVTFIPKTSNTKTNKKNPYCLILKTNVGRIFLKLIKKQFSKVIV